MTEDKSMTYGSAVGEGGYDVGGLFCPGGLIDYRPHIESSSRLVWPQFTLPSNVNDQPPIFSRTDNIYGRDVPVIVRPWPRLRQSKFVRLMNSIVRSKIIHRTAVVIYHYDWSVVPIERRSTYRHCNFSLVAIE